MQQQQTQAHRRRPRGNPKPFFAYHHILLFSGKTLAQPLIWLSVDGVNVIFRLIADLNNLDSKTCFGLQIVSFPCSAWERFLQRSGVATCDAGAS
jgi:hypothetical protein